MWPTGKFSRVCWEAAGEGGVEKLCFSGTPLIFVKLLNNQITQTPQTPKSVVNCPIKF